MRATVPQNTRAMGQRTVLVTGASAGIGKAAAIGIAKTGAHVLLLCRERTRGEAARAEVLVHDPEAELFLADLSSQAEVRRVAAEILAAHPRLDVLLNNAGGVFPGRTLTVDGLEMTFALNHLGPFLLTNLLLTALRAATPSRVVNVASEAHQGARIPFDDLMGEKSYGGFEAYKRSKLANLLFTYELARRLEGTGVTCNALHPGVVATEIARRAPWLVRWVWGVVTRSPEKGARTSITLATSPDVANVTGAYFIDEKAARSSRESRDPEVARHFWDVSEKLTSASR